METTHSSGPGPRPVNQHAEEVRRGDRFRFGANWRSFLKTVTPQKIALAEASLGAMLNRPRLDGLRFLDAGSGSGLFSLAARNLGASVHSFDFDPDSVACTTGLRDTYFLGDPAWNVEEGSVLSKEYLRGLGTFDIVYSWGVLHHTGAMWQAIDNVSEAVAPGGRLFIALYNDQGPKSARWKLAKRTYNALPSFLKLPFTLAVMGPRELRMLAGKTLRGKPHQYFDYVSRYAERSLRGMSYWHDIVDWIGGYPFEVSTPEATFNFLKSRGFRLDALKTVGAGHGCNEYVFSREARAAEVAEAA